MDRLKLVQRVRALTRDFSNSIFRENDIVDFINEGIDRFKQIIPEFEGLEYLLSNQSVPTLIPSHYRYLLSVYSASRCFSQDEVHYQASTLMNEFETKADELRVKIENGEVTIKDANGNVITRDSDDEYVDISYFKTSYADVDLGVEGVE